MLLVSDAVSYELSPAFDVLPSGQALGYQQMRVGQEGADSTLSFALSLCSQFGLAKDVARRVVLLVARSVAGWRRHFVGVGVSSGDIEPLSEHIERPFLRKQREEFEK